MTTTTSDSTQESSRDVDASDSNHWWRSLTIVDRFGLCVLGLLPIALLPGFFFPTNARQVLLIASVPLGGFLLVRLAVIRRDRAAVVAIAFLVAALISALRSDYRTVSVLGTTSTELSVIALIAAFGWWAIGRSMSSTAIDTTMVALTAGAGLNIVVGLCQIVLEPTSGLYHGYGGRLSGLMSNPVFFASTYVGIWAYWFVRSLRANSRPSLALNFVLVASVALSGSRGALLVALLITVAGFAARRDRHAFRSMSASFAGIAFGLTAFVAFAPSQSERFSGTRSSSSFGLRLDVWKAALEVWSERPVLGTGPNPFLRELNSAIPSSVYRDFGRIGWLDPHNVFVLVLLTTGLVGFGLLIAFTVIATRGHVNVALLMAAVAMVLSWMLQPVVLTTWPIAFALFGAAVRPEAMRLATPLRPRLASWLIIAGVIPALIYGAWSVQYRAASDSRDPDRIDSAGSVMHFDPAVAAQTGRFHKNANAAGEELSRHLTRSAELAERAVQNGGRAGAWQLLVEAQLLQGDPLTALGTARRWVEEWPNDPAAYQHLAVVARAAGRPEVESAAVEQLCSITQECDDGVLDID